MLVMTTSVQWFIDEPLTIASKKKTFFHFFLEIQERIDQSTTYPVFFEVYSTTYRVSIPYG